MSNPTQTPAAPKAAAKAPATTAAVAAAPAPAPTSKPAPEPIDVGALVLGPIADLSIARLQAARSEVAGWARNLTHALADDVTAGRLTAAEVAAVAEAYRVPAPAAD
jgi:hypothetical protein